MSKVCSTCDVCKPFTDFYSKKGIPVSICKACTHLQRLTRREKIASGTYIDASSLVARTSSFMLKAKDKHGGKFCYDGASYIDMFTKVEIVCKEHGQTFFQAPLDHLVGGGCIECKRQTFKVKSDDRCLTRGEFIERSKAANEQSYDYDGVEYVNNSTKVTIGCKTHGIFTILPNHHLRGRGCSKCSVERVSRVNTISTEAFIVKAREVHLESYCYSATNYCGSFVQVEIGCKKCNSRFSQLPSNHLQGNGCPVCAKEKIREKITLTRQEFIQRATTKHGILYDYSDTSYTRGADSISIFCNRHRGYFSQLADSHLAGIGCSSCATTGYSTNKQGTLYMLTCGDITKIGITNNGSLERAKSISKSYGGNFSIMREWAFDSGSIPDRVETVLLRVLRKKYDRPVARFQGSSEAFINVDRAWLLAEIDSEIIRQSQSN